LGTALLIAASGLIVMLLAGLQIRLILIALPLLGAPPGAHGTSFTTISASVF